MYIQNIILTAEVQESYMGMPSNSLFEINSNQNIKIHSHPNKTIQMTGGNVGMGTTTPISIPLHVYVASSENPSLNTLGSGGISVGSTAHGLTLGYQHNAGIGWLQTRRYTSGLVEQMVVKEH